MSYCYPNERTGRHYFLRSLARAEHVRTSSASAAAQQQHMSRLRDARLSSSTMHFTPTRPKAVVQPFFNLHPDGHLSALRHDQVQGAGLRSTEDAQIAQIAPFAGTRKAVPYTGFQATDSRFCDNGCQKHCAPRTYDLACRSVVRIKGGRAWMYLRSSWRFSLPRRVSLVLY